VARPDRHSQKLGTVSSKPLSRRMWPAGVAIRNDVISLAPT
jgi:hypothetical protein